ncbi:Qat anti-phage system TatD family nuclease QatD [Massilia phyllosphaerae]|uniref:Qat anti-phage system TatD family nuclease QatD n=1 Tax=Massilia phyllosphaerae TaxID=3106034 RepID=UPI002B1CAD54|nr:Qat anti-phage system TatD family nuclease QatD [Massilia sp. SGZ-792]
MDFHCHLDLYPDARSVYAEANRRMDFTWLVTTSPRAFAATSKVLPPTETIIVSPGLHPEVAAQKATELELLLQQIKNSMAVGEVGIDGSARYRQHFDLQKHIFSAVVERAQSLGGRVLSIHSRAAANEVLSVLEEFPGFGTAVLHWFTDSASVLRKAISMGCWFSVGPAMLTSANGRKLATMLPVDRVVPESDGPFAKTASGPIMPWEAAGVAGQLGELWRMPPGAANEQLVRNGQALRSKLVSKA